MYNILISGYYGFNNIGDDAILRAVTENLREKLPDTRITVLSNDPKDTEEKYGVRAVKRMSPFKILREILRCDMLISGGGSLLQDATSRLSILYYLAIIRMGKLFGKKVFIYSQGVGPITGGFSRWLTARCLRRVDAIAVRDEKSALLLEELGVPPELITITADPVLRLKPAGTERGEEILGEVGLKRSPERLTVGLAVRPDGDNPGFTDEVEKTILWLRSERNADCVLIPFHYERDRRMIEELSERLGPSVYAVMGKHLSDDMLSIIGCMDVMVGVRLHSLIYAAIMDVPCIGISYDPKVDSFMESIAQYTVSSTGDFTLDRFKEVFDDTVRRREELSRAARERVAQLKKRLDVNEDIIKALMQ